MKYALAILIPPLGLVLEGKVFQGLLNFILMISLIGWPFAALWAVLVVHNGEEERRNRRLLQEMRQRS